MNQFMCALVLSVALLSGCATSVLNPDGTVTVSEPDYTSIQIMSSATVAAWAATQKNGINTNDAKTVVKMLDVLENYISDGSAIDPQAWSKEIKAHVPARYQPMAMILMQLVQHQLATHGVDKIKPTPGSTPFKIMEAVRTGIMLALAPYNS